MNAIKIYFNLAEVASATTLSETTIQKLVTIKEFPAPRHLGGRRVGWLVSEVTAWAEARPVSDLPPPPNTGAKKPGRASRPTAQAAQIAA